MYSIDEMAEVCHTVVRMLQVINAEAEVSPEWSELSDEGRKDARRGVMNCLLGETPEELHNSWWRGKVKDGWTWGPVKSAELREHPCMVPYDELSDEQKLKDALFVSIVSRMEES